MAELTPERLAELRRIAEAATPGPWEWNKYLHLFSEATGKPVLTKPFSPDNPDVVEARPEDLDYIERFDPETALALLDRIEALERERQTGMWLSMDDCNTLMHGLRSREELEDDLLPEALERYQQLVDRIIDVGVGWSGGAEDA